MKYRIDYRNGESREFSSKQKALASVRRNFGGRVYTGASGYTVDMPVEDERVYGTATDLWSTRGEAKNENGSQAPAVLSVW